MEFTIKNILEDDERILWQGKPNYKRYMYTTYLAYVCVAPLLFVISLYFLMVSVLAFLISCSVILLLVVFIGFIFGHFAKKGCQNMLYAFTNKRIISQHGIVAPNYKSIDYSKISDISLQIGYINNKYNTGTIILMSNARLLNSLSYLDNPYDAFKTIKKICEDNRMNG